MMYFVVVTLLFLRFDIVLAAKNYRQIVDVHLSSFNIVLAAKNYRQIVDVHLSSFKCGQYLYSSINSIFEVLPLPVYNNDIGKGYMKNGKFYAFETRSEISDECHDNFNLNSELLGHLQEMSHFINIFNSAFSNCSHVFRENISAPSGYYTLRAVNDSLISVYCDLSFLNCSQILQVYSTAPSGYYIIQAPNGSLISVYCDMEGSKCDGKGGWMRVTYLNMSKPNATCPSGLNSYFF